MTIEIAHYTASLRGDREAFGEIVRRNQNLVSAITYSITGNVQESEDLAQETFITAWQRLGELRDVEKLPAWLCGIARNLANNYLRRTKTERQARTETALENVAATPCCDETEAESEEQIALLWATLKEIPMQFREPLIMYYRQNQSVADIAAALELTEDNVRQRIARGRTFLKKEVERRVEQTLWRIKPGEHFTVAVLAALPILATGNQVFAASSAGVAATQSASAGGASAGTSFVAGVATFFHALMCSWPTIFIGIGIALGIWSGVRNAPTLRARQWMLKVTFGYVIIGCLWLLTIPLVFAISMSNITVYFIQASFIQASIVSLPFLIVVASYWVNRKWRKIVEEDLANNAVIPAKAGIQTNDVSPVSLDPRLRGGDGKNDFSRSMYLWVGIAAFFPVLAIAAPVAIESYHTDASLWGTEVFVLFGVPLPFWVFWTLCGGLATSMVIFAFFYYALQMSKDQASFAKYPPRLPNLLAILTGEEKAPKGFRNRINFWGDFLGIGWGLFLLHVILSSLYRNSRLSSDVQFLSSWSPIILVYFVFLLFFAGIPRRRYWGMIFLGVSTLLIYSGVVSAHFTIAEPLLNEYVVKTPWIVTSYYGLSGWYVLCFTLFGVLGLYAFRKKN